MRRPQSPEFREAQLKKFRELAPEVDIVITTALIPGRPAPKLWTEDMVALMKRGSVIIDLAAERGGNCDLTVPDEKIVTDNGVTIVGYTDFPSRMATQASTLYSNNIRHMLTDLTPKKDGVIDHNMEDDVIRGATVAHGGEVTFPPPPPKVAGDCRGQSRRKRPRELTPEERRAKEVAAFKAQTRNQVGLLAIGGGLMLLAGLYTPASFMSHFIVFVLSVFVGFQVIWNVSHSAAHAADGDHQCDLVDHHPGRAVADRLGQLPGDHPGCAVGPDGRDQHLRRLHGHPAHARHVPEVVRGGRQWNIGFTTAAYVVAAVLFIQSLGGLSGQESAKRAVWYGIVGMALAVLATLFGPGIGNWMSRW